MDWLLDTRQDKATNAALEALEDHLRRHTSDESLAPSAVDAVHSALTSATGQHLLWLELDWTRLLPVLRIQVVPDGSAPLPDNGFGYLSPVEREFLRESLRDSNLDDPTTVQLTTPRDVVANFDPDQIVLVDLHPLTDGPSAATVALAAAAESHPVASPDQVAAAAGALLADACLRDEKVTTADEVTELFGRLHTALGGACRPVRTSDDGFELVVDQSPFGAALAQIPSLSRITEAMAGRLAAYAFGKATVVHDESIALGDPSGRLLVLLGDVEEEICGSTYVWPPAGTNEQADPSPRLEMSVSLPRQSHSVPVIRRLAAQILRAFGVAADDIHDVELAISEACANVIQHAVDSEGYEVSIELAADRCAITVLDRGDGFDAAIHGHQEDDDAESGRGLSLMRALVDNLNFVSEPKVGAVVHMVKQLTYDDSHPFRQRTSASAG